MKKFTFALGFTCGLTSIFSAFLIYMESGYPERASGRDKLRGLVARIELIIASNNTHEGQQKGDPEPDKGNNRRRD